MGYVRLKDDSRTLDVGSIQSLTLNGICTVHLVLGPDHLCTWIWCLSLRMRSGSVRPLALGSKKTMALRQANSVSSIWISRNGSTSSLMTLIPMLCTTASYVGRNNGKHQICLRLFTVMFSCLCRLLSICCKVNIKRWEHYLNTVLFRCSGQTWPLVQV